MILKILFLLGVLEGLCANEIQSRVAGQPPPSVGKYPFIVSLQNKDLVHQCTGAIIDNRWILSAASCVGTTAVATAVKYIRMGSESLVANDGVILNIDSIILHDYFDATDATNNPIPNNIALVKTKTPITYTTKIRNIALSGSRIGSGVTLTVVGWGATVAEGPLQNLIRVANMFSIQNDQCKLDLPASTITADNLCATYVSRGACDKDDGAPVVANNRLEGIVVPPHGCGTRHDIYLRVYSYINWINEARRR